MLLHSLPQAYCHHSEQREKEMKVCFPDFLNLSLMHQNKPDTFKQKMTGFN